jgi:uncharacterized YigZ family protein
MVPMYYTVKTRAQAEIEIKRSRFIAAVCPVANEEAALAFIEGVRREHRKANHNVYAYTIGPEGTLVRFSDDGEPGGTAGRPVLDVIERERLLDTVVVVTRYFGGIKLGAGGLVRAYGQTAKAGIDAAGVLKRVLFGRLTVSIDYEWLGQIQHLLQAGGHLVASADYADKVALSVLVKDSQNDGLALAIQEATNGQARIAIGEGVFLDEPGVST